MTDQGRLAKVDGHVLYIGDVPVMWDDMKYMREAADGINTFAEAWAEKRVREAVDEFRERVSMELKEIADESNAAAAKLGGSTKGFQEASFADGVTLALETIRARALPVGKGEKRK